MGVEAVPFVRFGGRSDQRQGEGEGFVVLGVPFLGEKSFCIE